MTLKSQKMHRLDGKKADLAKLNIWWINVTWRIHFCLSKMIPLFTKSGWWFQIFFIFNPIGEDYHFENSNIFHMGWNHQLVVICHVISSWLLPLQKQRNARKPKGHEGDKLRKPGSEGTSPIGCRSNSTYLSWSMFFGVGRISGWNIGKESIGQLPSRKLTYPLKIDPWKFGYAYGKSSF